MERAMPTGSRRVAAPAQAATPVPASPAGPSADRRLLYMVAGVAVIAILALVYVLLTR